MCGGKTEARVHGQPPEYRELHSGDVSITYIDTEPGLNDGNKTVLLVHGILSSSYMFSSGKNGCGLIDALVTAGFRVLAVDCRGHGLSDKPGRGHYGMKMVQDMANLLDELSLDKVHVAGYSMGAELSIKFTTTLPSRVRSLCAAGSGWTGSEQYQEYSKYGRTLRNPCVKTLNACGCLSPLMMCFMGETFDIGSGSATMEMMNEIIGIPEEDMRAIAVPVCGIMGEKDPERHYSERMQGVVTDFSLTIIQGCDHMTAPDDPMYNATVVQFLARVRDGSQQ
eukprot:GFYU01019945.1.p1 GENE.GFYU01019945.1~~GFYU01019945.1.p1  ORF type:complete len:281 (-),score=28.22 GFYU01019945.1:56-898(-)